MALLPAATENAGLDAMFTSSTAPYIGLNTGTPGTSTATLTIGFLAFCTVTSNLVYTATMGALSPYLAATTSELVDTTSLTGESAYNVAITSELVNTVEVTSQ